MVVSSKWYMLGVLLSTAFTYNSVAGIPTSSESNEPKLTKEVQSMKARDALLAAIPETSSFKDDLVHLKSSNTAKYTTVMDTLLTMQFQPQTDHKSANVGPGGLGIAIVEPKAPIIPNKDRKRYVLDGGRGNRYGDIKSYLASGVPFFSSKPNAKNILYVDFDGGQMNSGSLWGRGKALCLKPYNRDGVPGFSSDEINAIWQSMHAVAEDFAEFDIDVTTKAPACFVTGYATCPLNILWVVVTDYYDCNQVLIFSTGIGGVAYVNVFKDPNYFTSYAPAFVFNSGFVGISEAISHEIGHNLGLSHDGRKAINGQPPLEYYAGGYIFIKIVNNTIDKMYGNHINYYN